MIPKGRNIKRRFMLSNLSQFKILFKLNISYAMLHALCSMRFIKMFIKIDRRMKRWYFFITSIYGWVKIKGLVLRVPK